MSNGNGKREIRNARRIKAVAILAAITTAADWRRIETELAEAANKGQSK